MFYKSILLVGIFILFIWSCSSDGDEPQLFLEIFEMSEWQNTDNFTEPYIHLNYMRFEKNYPIIKKDWFTTNLHIQDLECFSITSDKYWNRNPEITIIEHRKDYLEFDLAYISPNDGSIVRSNRSFLFKDEIMTERIKNYFSGNQFTFTWERSEVDLDNLEICDK